MNNNFRRRLATLEKKEAAPPLPLITVEVVYRLPNRGLPYILDFEGVLLALMPRDKDSGPDDIRTAMRDQRLAFSVSLGLADSFGDFCYRALPKDKAGDVDFSAGPVDLACLQKAFMRAPTVFNAPNYREALITWVAERLTDTPLRWLIACCQDAEKRARANDMNNLSRALFWQVENWQQELDRLTKGRLM